MKVSGRDGDIKIYEYPKDGFHPQAFQEVGGRKKYVDIFGCFDIETSNVADVSNDGRSDMDEQIAIMYIWQYCERDGEVYYGRTWSSLQRFVRELQVAYGLSSSLRMAWYVHNLAFEFQFIRSVFSISEVFATEQRKVIRCMLNNVIEARCSYRLTNMSLEKFCQSQQTFYQKIQGFDYDKVRYPDTKLSEFDLSYALMDVISQHQAIEKLMKSENDDIVSIPMTSTGYVRREARDRINDDKNQILIKRTALDTHMYKLCKAATRGGDTHANILYIGNILDNVFSYDRSSSYPHVMVTGKRFPVTKYINERHCKQLKAPPKGLSAIMMIEYRNLNLKPTSYMPYLPYSRAVEIVHPKWNDNGRVISCEIYVGVFTDVDFEIIEDDYDYDDLIIHEMFLADRGQLPKSYREYIMELYIRKSELKDGDKYYYDKFKNRLNSTFGMMLTDVTREDIVYSHDQWQENVLPDIPKALTRYYNNPKSFLMYQSGIYVTALARYELRRSIKICGRDTVYVDTDSNKHINDHSADFTRLNKEIHRENLENDIIPIVTVKGVEYEMGVWEDEGNGSPEYAHFVTMGAKKYAYQYPSGKYGVTVAGLNKQKGAELLSNVGLDEFQEGLIFDPTFSGRLTAKYDDRVRLEKKMIDGHLCEVTSNVALLPTSYSLGLGADFAEAVEAAKQGEVVPK